jgi:putative transposase
MIIEFIDAQRRCGHRIFAVCQVLGTLGVVFSDRAYRKARTRPPAARACADAVVVEALLSTRRPDPKTRRPPRERFYGRRKMTHWLRRKGLNVSYCQVDRLMRQERLHGLRRGRIKATTRRDDTHTPASDLVGRNFTAAVPDQLWIADMTYVSTWAGWCYTSFVVDVFSQRILGWAIATTMTTQLVQDALAMAVWQRDHHAHPIAGGVVHHSDKGSPNTPRWRSVNPWPTTRSCPQPGRSAIRTTTALMESINGLYKNECIKPEGPIRTWAQAEYATAEWVDWYNHDRLHSTLEYRPPAEYEQAHYDQLLAVLQPEPAHR